MFVEVLVGYPPEGTFTYSVPAGVSCRKGMRVLVNFSGRNTVAYIVETHDKQPEYKVKNIIEVVDDSPIFDERLIECVNFVSRAYISSAGEAMAKALPSAQKPSGRYKLRFERKEAGQITLSEEQGNVLEDMFHAYGGGERFHLIFGITGSGKTEIYIEAARKMLARGKSSLFLVPEITLSSQIFERLSSVFKDELVIYHSQLTAAQRLHHWKKFYSGECRVAVGTRSAVFLQCPDLGIIIIDEEQDGSYKEHSTPRYDARRVAFYRCIKEGALCVSGSATPSIESLHSCENGKMRLHRLYERFSQRPLPEIEVVKVDPKGGDAVISSKLQSWTSSTVREGKQAVFLLNRRGFAPIVICEKCGSPVECPHCSISMNYHNTGLMVCHYCGHSEKVPGECVSCRWKKFIFLGAGTQRVEEKLQNVFPDMKIKRLDQDAARKKGASHEIVKQMLDGEIDILLGTQMVAKGFDFPGVTLSAVLMADIGLHLPDFRASERIFSLLVQVAGRSGRGEAAGRVIVQTLDDDHEIFGFIKGHNYEAFYEWEIEMRRSLMYPPFGRLARLLVRGSDEEAVRAGIESAKEIVQSIIKNENYEVQLLGPSAAPFEKIGGNYRHHMILKGSDINILRGICRAVKLNFKTKGLYLEVDIDPVDML